MNAANSVQRTETWLWGKSHRYNAVTAVGVEYQPIFWG